MAPPDGRPSKKVEGKPGKGGAKRSSGKRQGDSRRGAARNAEDSVDFGPPLQKRGLFAGPRADICPLRNLMYGHGDARPEAVLNASVDLVEDIVIDYCSALLRNASDQATLRGTKVQPEDILFLLRKDRRKFARAKELLTMNEEIKQARKQFEDDDALLKK